MSLPGQVMDVRTVRAATFLEAAIPPPLTPRERKRRPSWMPVRRSSVISSASEGTPRRAPGEGESQVAACGAPVLVNGQVVGLLVHHEERTRAGPVVQPFDHIIDEVGSSAAVVACAASLPLPIRLCTTPPASRHGGGRESVVADTVAEGQRVAVCDNRRVRAQVSGASGTYKNREKG